MRHRKAGRKLGRNASHRLALYRNLAKALIRHERIITTLEKAKAVRPFVEKLITLAKKNTLHTRRLVIARLGPVSNIVLLDKEDKEAVTGADNQPQTVVKKLFDELGPRYADRPGGYTRIIKRHQRRLGDAGRTAYLELLKAGETKKKAKAAPAPRVEEETPPQEQEQAPPQEQEQTPAPEGQTPPTPEGATEPKPEGSGEQQPPK